MPNRKQRDKNRANYAQLLNSERCNKCGMPGRHFLVWPPYTLEDAALGREMDGFWTCPNLYDVNGVQIL